MVAVVLREAFIQKSPFPPLAGRMVCSSADAELSDVIVFAAPLSAPAAARAARAPPLLRSNTLNFMALQIRVGA